MQKPPPQRQGNHDANPGNCCGSAPWARLCISALSGGGGKTLLALGLAKAFAQAGLTVQPFKKGPDYIDAAWLSLAGGRPASNLDPYFLQPEQLRALFDAAMRRAQALGPGQAGQQRPEYLGQAGQALQAAGQTGTPLGLVEGNRGLCDGLDVAGSCSTAELARILSCPVLLSLDCTKMTRTAAALVRGVLAFEPGLYCCGLVLNRVASPRHEEALRRALEAHTDVPVLGALPRLRENPLPERHMGIASQGDALADNAQAVLERLANLAREHLDLNAVLTAACAAPPLPLDPGPAFWQPPPETHLCPQPLTLGEMDNMGKSDTDRIKRAGGPGPELSLLPTSLAAPLRPDLVAPAGSASGPRPRLGYVRDAALWFYYEENLEALRRAGAELIRLSLLDAAPWPKLDGLYLGGGFPEDVAPALSASPHLSRLAALAAEGLPIYAECGGFMALSRGIERHGHFWPMAGIFPVTAQFCPRPQGLGYVCATVLGKNPYFPLGLSLRGHEFHYSRCVPPTPDSQNAPDGRQARCVLSLERGSGMGGLPGQAARKGQTGDGLVQGRVWASYLHIFAPAVPCWAYNFTAAARAYAQERQNISRHACEFP